MRPALSIFLLFQALYALTSSGNAFRVPDEFEVYYQVEHLVDAGDLSIPQAMPSGRFFGRLGVDGKPYAPYGPLIAFLAIPHHLAARSVASIAGLPRESVTWTFVVSGLTMLSTSTGAALAVAGFCRAAMTLGASRLAALQLSLMLGGATVLWAYGTSFYSEGWQAAMFIWAAVCLLERRIVLASSLLAAAGLVKVTGLIFAPAFVVAVLFDRSLQLKRRIRAALALASGIITSVAIHLAWNAARFGDVFQFGYDWTETVSTMPARAFLMADLPRGLAILLLSPGKSLLLWAPVVVLSVMRWRSCPRAVLIGTAAAAVGGLLLYATYLFPEGGYAHGPRHLVPIIPLLLLPAAASGRAFGRKALIVCTSIGLPMALLAVSVSFLQDQAMGADFARRGYYERIDPPVGRAWNRYRFGYVPFVTAMSSGDWPKSDRVGTGMDVFPLHLLRAKQTIPEAAAIPLWLPWFLFIGWTSLFVGVAATVWRGVWVIDPGGREPQIGSTLPTD